MEWWLIGGAIVGVLIAMGKSGVGQNGKPVVTVEVGNMAARSEITKWTNRGYALTSDSVHTFGKHTLVFTKQSVAGSTVAARPPANQVEISWLDEGGKRYRLGCTLTSPYYGIWDGSHPGAPIAKFPYTEHGKVEAIERIQQLERDPPTPAVHDPSTVPGATSPTAGADDTASPGPTATQVASGAWASEGGSGPNATDGRVVSPFTGKSVTARRRNRGLIALVVVAALSLTYGWVASRPNVGHSQAPPSPAASNGVGQGFGTSDASADVTLGNCSTSFGTITCEVDILNHSDGTSDYYIEAEVDDTSGANIGMVNAVASHVGAGQAAHAELFGGFTGSADDVTVKLTEVQRTAS